MNATANSTSSPVAHSIIPLETPLIFQAATSFKHEPVNPYMPAKLYLASQKPSGLSRELEIMMMMYANTTILNTLRAKVLPRWGYAHLTPLNNIMAQHDVPLSYGSMIHPTNPERYQGSYQKYLYSPERYGWSPPRRNPPGTELVTFTFESQWFDERWTPPSKFESFVTTTEVQAENVQQVLANLIFESLLP